MNCYKLSIKLIIFNSIFFLNMKSDEISITKEDQIKPNAGKLVTVIGIYKKLYLPEKMKRPGEKEDTKKVFGGRICIQLSDNSEVALEVNKKGIRSEEEIKKFEGKKVSISGIIYSWAPLWGDGKETSIIMNCLRDIKSIQLKNND